MITGAHEDGQFDEEYHNFDNPLYSESGEARAITPPPTYNRTSLPGPRGATANSRRSGNGSSDRTIHGSAVPRPEEYAYVSVMDQQVASIARKTRTTANRQQDQDGVYEPINIDHN